MNLKTFYIAFLLLSIGDEIFSQAPGCPDIDAGPDQNLTCLTNCTTLTATLIQSGQTTDYMASAIAYAPPMPYTGGTQIIINVDDVWSGVINLPFNFCFYGNMYSQIVVGANGLITFDVSQATQYCEWAFTGSIPSPGPPSSGGLYNNSIMGAYHDLDPSFGGNINYYISGTSPCRMFVINYYDVPHFDCDCFLFNPCKRSTQQIVIYETTNVIEVYIQKKETCSSWNSGNAVIGIQNSTGTAGVAAPGRNTGPWSATNEAWRFTPSGAPNYLVTWLDMASNTLGTGTSLSVCPTGTTTYIAQATYQHCDGSQVIVDDTVIINVPGGFTTSLFQTNTVCTSCTGTATVTASGGTPPFTYDIGSGNQSTGNFTALCAGSYSVSVSDGSGCSGTVPVTITTGPQAIFATPVSADINCNGNGNGAIDLTVSGGSTPYSFLWSNAAVTEDLTNLQAGTYTVTVTDNSGCTTTASSIIAEPAALVKVTAQTDILCNGDSTGNAAITISGGTGAYTYAWLPSVSSSGAANNLGAGTYVVTVTDQNICTITHSFTITQPQQLALTFSEIQPTCTDSSGSITASVTGGVTSYSYAWLPGSSSSNPLSGIPAGMYSVTVTDANGCTFADSLFLAASGNMLLAISSLANASCSGSNDGSATVTPTGIPPYTYLWVPAAQVTQTATGLPAGDYTVYVTDGSGCINDTSVTITEPLPLVVAAITAPAACSGSADGLIDIFVSGGTSLYTYLWNDNSTSEDISGGAGVYTVTITDSKSCTTTYSDTITEPPAIILATASSQATCNQADGTVSVTANGGSGSFSYYWLPGGATTAIVLNLYAGIYIVTVTDGNGCTAVASEAVTNPNAPVVSISSVTDVTCNGDGDGTITITASGGIPPLTYSWNTSPPQNGTTVNNLTGGTYTVTVTDSLGCSVTADTTIIDPAAIVVTISGEDTICEGESVVISASATGGTLPLTYMWDSNLGQGPVQTVSPSVTDTFTVIVVDANNCTSQAQSVIITTDIPLAVILNGTTNICEGQSSTLTASGSGGNGGPFTYSWSTNETGNPINVSPAVTTTYTITVTDDCGSPVATASITVTVAVSNMVAGPGDQGCPSETFLLTASGALTYWWSTADSPTDNIGNGSSLPVNPLVSTQYIVHGFDGSCDDADTIPVIIVPPPDADFTIFPDTTTLLLPDVLFTDASSADAVTWNWDFGDGDEDSLLEVIVHTYRDTGTYFITLYVTNSERCADMVTKTLRIEPEFMLFVPSAFTPNNDGKNDGLLPVFIGVNPKWYRFTIFDRWGDQIFETSDPALPWDGSANNGRNEAQQDIYVWTIETKDLSGKGHTFIGHIALVK